MQRLSLGCHVLVLVVESPACLWLLQRIRASLAVVPEVQPVSTPFECELNFLTALMRSVP